MTRLALILALIASPVAADDLPREIVGMFGGGDHVIVIEAGPNHFDLTYTNTFRETSRTGRARVGFGDMAATVWVDWGDGAMEKVTVIPDPPFFAFPAEVQVKDGDAVTIRIIPAMF